MFIITTVKANRICVLIFRDSTSLVGGGIVFRVVETTPRSIYRIRFQERHITRVGAEDRKGKQTEPENVNMKVMGVHVLLKGSRSEW